MNLKPAPNHLPQVFSAVLGAPHVYVLPDTVVAEGISYAPGYYFSTPFEDLEGPFATVAEATEAMITLYENL